MSRRKKPRVDVAAAFAEFDHETHPAAKLIRAPTEEEFLRLEQSIRDRGQQVSGWRLDGLIVDGRTRRAIAQRLKTKFAVKDVELADGETAIDLVLDCNVNRRHLTPAECKAIAKQMLREAPARSDRQIAAKTGVSDKTVGQARKELESTAEIPQLTERTGADGRKRKAKPEPLDEPRDSLGKPIPEHLRDAFAEAWYADAIRDLDVILRKAEIAAAAIEGAAADVDGNPYLQRTKLLSDLSMAVHSLRSAKRRVQDAKPDAVCTDCGGAGCKACQRAGWVPFQLETR